jgi:hypothetical protein
MAEAAFERIHQVVTGVVTDLDVGGEPVPEPILQ